MKIRANKDCCRVLTVSDLPTKFTCAAITDGSKPIQLKNRLRELEIIIHYGQPGCPNMKKAVLLDSVVIPAIIKAVNGPEKRKISNRAKAIIRAGQERRWGKTRRG